MKTHIILFFCALYIIALPTSLFLLSISMFGLAVAALIKPAEQNASFSFVLDRRATRRLFRAYQYPSLAIITLLFLVVFVSIWQGGDVYYWLSRVRVKLPLLVVPLMFIMFPKFTNRQMMGLFYLLVLWMSVNCLGVGINYLLDTDSINLLIKQGKSMPSPVNHIRFSVLIAYGVICGTYLYFKGFYWKFRWENYLILSLTIFLAVFLHLFAVRSGLVVLYASLLVMTIYLVIRTKKIWLGAALLTTIILMPVVSFYYLPSFQAKVLYMDYDRWMHNRGDENMTADSGRIISLMVGYELFKKQPIFGLGVGHIKKEVDGMFKQKKPSAIHALMPHNQLLYTMTATGVFGLVISLFAFLYPLFYRKNYQHPMLLASFTVFISISMIEHSLENSGGIAFYVFFLCLLLNHLNLE